MSLNTVNNILPISLPTFASKSWKKVPNYLFAIKDMFCALSLQEIPKAVVDMPIGFIKTNNNYSLISILGLHENRNLYVNNNGSWRGRYIPALLRAYPFVLARNESVEDQLVLCFNEASGLITNNDENVAFFDKKGELSPEVKKLMQFLQAIHSDRLTTDRMCTVLNEYDLIKPWSIEIEFSSGPLKVEGLFGIDEKSLNELSGAKFLELRKLGAIQIAYCQLLSMQHIKTLIQLIESQAKSGKKPFSDELSFDSFDAHGNINFDNL